MEQEVQFDHSKNVQEAYNERGRFLVQDGIYFSFASYDRQNKRYKPEPVPVDLNKISREEMKDLINKLISHLDAGEKLMDKLRTAFMDNLELFKPTTTAKVK